MYSTYIGEVVGTSNQLTHSRLQSSSLRTLLGSVKGQVLLLEAAGHLVERKVSQTRCMSCVLESGLAWTTFGCRPIMK